MEGVVRTRVGYAGYDDEGLRESPAAATPNGVAAGREAPRASDLGVESSPTAGSR